MGLVNQFVNFADLFLMFIQHKFNSGVNLGLQLLIEKALYSVEFLFQGDHDIVLFRDGEDTQEYASIAHI